MGVSESLITTGIEHASNEFYKVFPNPCKDMVSFVFPIETSGNVTINLLNTRGEKVKSIHKDFSLPSTYQINMDLQGLSIGIYFFQLILPGKTLNGKITVI